MKRGDIYRLKKRAFVVVSRQVLLDSEFSTVICVPVYSTRSGLSTQVDVGPDVGLKHERAVFCDALVSVERARLSDFVGSLPTKKVEELNAAIAVALGLA